MTTTASHRWPASREVGRRPAHVIPIVELRGRGLRFILLDHLMSAGQATVAEMVSLLARRGYELAGRPSKVISDALRWEVRRKRVVRVARGVYRYRSAPPSTARRVRLFAHRCHAWIAAVRRGRRPPPTPPDPRGLNGNWYTNPNDPPWRYLGWLWVR